MKSNKVLLITGGSGFVGTWLADEAIKAGYTLIGVDLRGPHKPEIWSAYATASCESVDFEALLKGVKLAAVCHLAGGASVPASVSDPYGDFSSLLPGTSRLALYLAKAQPQARLFLFSSAAVYGNPVSLPIAETAAVTPISPYGVHKVTAETLLSHYSRIFGLGVTIFRIFSIYGPGLRKQLIWDVSQRALKAAAKGENGITLFGTGQESRDFIYVVDLCRAALAVIGHEGKSGVEIYNLASGIESTIEEVAVSLVKHLGVNVTIGFNGERTKGDPVNWRADITRLKTVGYDAKFNLDEGLEQVAKWINAAQ